MRSSSMQGSLVRQSGFDRDGIVSAIARRSREIVNDEKKKRRKKRQREREARIPRYYIREAEIAAIYTGEKRSLGVACRLVSYHRSNGTKRDCLARYLGTRERSSGIRGRRSGDNPSPIVNALMELLNANVRILVPRYCAHGARLFAFSRPVNNPIKLTSLGRLARRERNSALHVATMNLSDNPNSYSTFRCTLRGSKSREED